MMQRVDRTIVTKGITRSCGAAALAACSLLVLASCATSSAPRQEHPIPQQPPRPTPLFDGTTLDGWERRGGAAEFKVEDGCIVGESRPGVRNSFLCTTHEYGDFDLSLDFRIDPGFNSGIQIRSHLAGEGDDERVIGYQVEIDPAERAWSAGIYEEGLRGWLAPLDTNPAAREAFRADAWNHLRIEARGPHLQTWLNGVPAANYLELGAPDDPNVGARRGFIALQVHSVGARQEPLRVRWRSIELVPIEEPCNPTDSAR